MDEFQENSEEFQLPLLHRDDLDPEVIKIIEEIMPPGFKMVCAGDCQGDLPPEMLENIKEIERRHLESAIHGICIDCGVQMENWPPPEDENQDWDLPEGWAWLSMGDQVAGFVCPDCNEKEGVVEIVKEE